MGFNSILRDSMSSTLDSELQYSFEAIDNSCLRLIRTIDQLLDMSQLQSGSYKAEFENINLYELVEGVVKNYQSEASSKNLGLHYINKIADQPTVLKDKYSSLRTYLVNRQAKPRKGETKKKSTSPDILESEDSKPMVPRVHEPVHFQVSTEEEEEFQLLPVTTGEYQLPTLSLLDKSEGSELTVDKEYYYGVSKELEEKLNDFGVVGKVVGISPGPVLAVKR